MLSVQGLFVGVEVKQKSGHLSPLQELTQAMVQNSGGVYIVVRSLEDFIEQMKGLELFPAEERRV